MGIRHKIAVFEHETLTLKNKEFTRRHLEVLQTFHGEKGVPYFSLVHKGIKFNQFVGVLQIGELTLEVLPKADKTGTQDEWRSRLIEMLHAVGEFNVDAPSESLLTLKNNSVLDLYFALFVKEVEYLLHQGLVKKYRRTEGNVKSLKGSLNFTKHLDHNLIHKERFYTAHTVYDQQHVLHAILLQALMVLKQLNTNASLTSRISTLLLNFPEQEYIKITESTLKRIALDRKTEGYKKALQIAELILLNYHPDLTNGRDNVLALMFDMNKLWEKYVYVGLKKNLKGIRSISMQHSKKFWQQEKGNASTMRPDIVINKGEPDCIVLDTKWKNLNGSVPSSEDLRQMYVYAKFYQTQKVALVYPGIENAEFTGNYYHEHTKELGDQSCSIITLRPEKKLKSWMQDLSLFFNV
ncbi:5-methylcytosine-specific restriction enzyme subunit McrC [Lishizhenia tianjinensis]|uniref:5-methylcytosine-specific restriction enzyme subunit McrC n=1 Tax=Lishizhenia tianjinensis TaxID=477690 RepID=A0A1I6XDT0_9FLAO|nr:5-methylcytosine-specific restriction enzyme subunit McrC [Lishizhenia tianjinensis]